MSDDEHIAELQRRAYGADTPDPVRALAAAELAELAALATAAGGSGPQAGAGDGIARDAVTRDAVMAVVGGGGVVGGVVDGPSPAPATARSAGRDGARSRIRRWAVAFGIAGLLLGAAVGTVVGRMTSVRPDIAPADVAPTGPAFGSGEPGTPLDDTGLPHLFDRLPPVSDDGPVEQAVGAVSAVPGIDPSSVRLVATRTDGPAAYIARTADGNDVCLVVVLLPDGPSAGRCTTGGRLPAGGLRVDYAAVTHGFVVAILTSAGTVTLGLNAGR